MNSGMEERRRAFEGKWVHDEELRFKVHVRRAKLLGLWAAGEMGMTGPAAEYYAATCVAADIQAGGDEALFHKIRADLDAKGTARTDHLIHRRMAEFLDAAKEQLMSEG